MRPSGTGRRYSTERTSMFYEESQICKQGHLRKSPPPNRFSSQSSWKKRLFILTKSKQNIYALHYYKIQHSEKRGVIEISQILRIQQGIDDEKKRSSVCKMFQCHPDMVISLLTTGRDYFLIGEDKKEVEEWLEVISTAWEETKQEEHNEPEKPFPEDKQRPSSDPLPAIPGLSPGLKTPDLECRRRTYSDPLPDLPEKHNQPPPKMVNIQAPENPCSQQGSKEDAIYDVPRRWQPLVREEPVECDDLMESGNETLDSDDDLDAGNHYVTMESLRNLLEISSSLPRQRSRSSSTDSQRLRNQPEISSSLPRQRSRSSSTDSQSSAEEHHEPALRTTCTACAGSRRSHSPSSHCRSPDEARLPKPKGLSDVRLKILLNECTAESQLKKLDIDLSKEDIKKHLTLADIGNRVCVSNWEGQSCLFNHGDQITSVNDLGVQSKADVLEYIQRAIKMKVTLSILRLPNSKVFQAEKCSCSLYQ
ncbi:pleckstrin homology domain-containing family S member 1 isoform X2 [Rhinatrema bivittatum]|uniref:pleckstrin homology domain-containing family S member 1 isoform X2 n=1 Tax=Rhinatrema bivittatum TaxID=194408 RepID=UPI001127BF87|nr:pleckstrin homology domain-containing family S member 1 isoform X2 [Rhinatrema bivittatum]